MGRKKSVKILVVGDDPLIADFFADIYTFLDYEYIRVSSGEQALQVASKQPPFDFLLTNIMPAELTGVDFVDQFSKLYPKTNVQYMII